MTRLLTSAAALFVLAACGGADTPEPPIPAAAEPAVPADAAAMPEETTDAAEAAAPSEPAENPFADLPAPYNDADYARGARTFKLCVSCHLVAEGAGHRVGPNLHGMFDRKVGEAEGFAYSDALLEADFDWTPEQLDDWLANPRSFLPGNRMSFSGVRRPEDRDAVIAYLMVETASAGE
ncbi:MAG: cytochrome c family protein [Pseudomonadota bacterium]